MKKLLIALLLIGLIVLPVNTKEKTPKYKYPEINVIAIYEDIGIMALCIDGNMWLLTVGGYLQDMHKKCEIVESKDI